MTLLPGSFISLPNPTLTTLYAATRGGGWPEASQKQSIYIPLYQQPEFEVSGPTADSTSGVFELEVSLKALPGYDIDVLFDGVKARHTDAYCYNPYRSGSELDRTFAAS